MIFIKFFKYGILFTLLVCLLLYPTIAYSQTQGELYSKGLNAAKNKELDLAFMYFRSLLQNYPDTKYKEEAVFAIGEYYFLIGDFQDAQTTLNKLISDFPQSKTKPFALVYLLKMAERKKHEELAENLKRDIISCQQLSFLFRDFKEYEYRSCLYRKHKVTYYIDKVEFYIDGELFAQIAY